MAAARMVMMFSLMLHRYFPYSAHLVSARFLVCRSGSLEELVFLPRGVTSGVPQQLWWWRNPRLLGTVFQRGSRCSSDWYRSPAWYRPKEHKLGLHEPTLFRSCHFPAPSSNNRKGW